MLLPAKSWSEVIAQLHVLIKAKKEVILTDWATWPLEAAQAKTHIYRSILRGKARGINWETVKRRWWDATHFSSAKRVTEWGESRREHPCDWQPSESISFGAREGKESKWSATLPILIFPSAAVKQWACWRRGSAFKFGGSSGDASHLAERSMHWRGAAREGWTAPQKVCAPSPRNSEEQEGRGAPASSRSRWVTFASRGVESDVRHMRPACDKCLCESLCTLAHVWAACAQNWPQL